MTKPAKHMRKANQLLRGTETDSGVALTRRGDVGETSAETGNAMLDDGRPPAELTGRAASTNEDLVSLMANNSPQHLEDGFQSGSGEDPETDIPSGDGDEEQSPYRKPQ